MARNLITEYNTKVQALKKVMDRKKTVKEIPEVRSTDFHAAEQMVAQAMNKRVIDHILNTRDLAQQRQRLSEFTLRAYEEVLPLIENASQPVFQAGNHVMDLTYKALGINRFHLFSGLVK